MPRVPSASRTTIRGSPATSRSEEHTSELQSHVNIVCRLLLEKKQKTSTRQGYPWQGLSHMTTPETKSNHKYPPPAGTKPARPKEREALGRSRGVFFF